MPSGFKLKTYICRVKGIRVMVELSMLFAKVIHIEKVHLLVNEVSLENDRKNILYE